MRPPAASSHSLDGSEEYMNEGCWEDSDYDRALLRDVQAIRVISLDSFCNQVFPILPNQHHDVLDRVADTPVLQTLLQEYCQPVEHESCRYNLFTRLANAAMTVLRTELDKDIELNDLVFCRNDPGSHALRKPDVVGVNTTTIVDNVDRRSVDSLANVEPSKAAFAWHELLMFIEFRLVDERIEHSPSANTDLLFNSEKSSEQATGNQPSVLNDVSDPGSDSDIAPEEK